MPSLARVPGAQNDVAASWVPGTAEHEGGISVHDVAAHELALVRCTGSLGEVDRAWQYLYRWWLPRSRYEPADIPAMELFRKLPEEIGWETFDLDAAIAIVPL